MIRTERQQSTIRMAGLVTKATTIRIRPIRQEATRVITILTPLVTKTLMLPPDTKATMTHIRDITILTVPHSHSTANETFYRAASTGSKDKVGVARP